MKRNPVVEAWPGRATILVGCFCFWFPVVGGDKVVGLGDDEVVGLGL